MKLLLAGATGLVGSAVARQALSAGHELTAVGRRPVEGAHANVSTDFTGDLVLPPADAALCALGTTIAAAGSRVAFRAVDHDAVLKFAGAAQDAQVPHFVVVTAVGASARSPIFYSRVKGEVEHTLRRLGFTCLDILHPGLLLGQRHERRPGERLFQRLDPLLRLVLVGPLDRYRGIAADTVAAAMLALCNNPGSGIRVHENADMRTLAGHP